MSPISKFAAAAALLFSSVADATITIAGTGERFPSYPDRLIGSKFLEGFEYMARLQYIPDDLDVCPSFQPVSNITIVPPRDGLPVVLLARGDYCSDYTKLQVAQSMIHPTGVVKYLIIYNPPTDYSGSVIQANRRKLMEKEEDKNVIQSTEVLGRQLRHKDHTHGADIKIGVLHVSSAVGQELLHLLENQQEQIRQYGGPRLLLDGHSSNATSAFLKSVLFWIGLSLMLSGCLCSFLLSMRVQDMLNEGNGQNQPQRPQRRRLDMNQVREWLEEYAYSEQEEEHGADTECSICLDDYCQGVVLRKLPCGHTYHTNCIAKWLTERSSTCPLCKLDLLPEEEDEEEEEEDVEMQELASGDGLIGADEEVDGIDDQQSQSFFTFLMGPLRRRRTMGVDDQPLLAPEEAQQQEDEEESEQDR